MTTRSLAASGDMCVRSGGGRPKLRVWALIMMRKRGCWVCDGNCGKEASKRTRSERDKKET